jgi:hypothetical protein
MQQLNITEKIIEDIFTIDKSLLANVLSVNQSDLNLIARQKKFENRRITDMLYLYRNELLLIELKAVPFYFEVINQINDYYQELIKLQVQSKLINTKINKIILVTDANEEHISLCQENDIKLIQYDLEDVLTKYYNDFKELSAFFNISPQALGISSLKLLKAQLVKVKQEYNFFKERVHTNKDKLAVANLLGLVDINNKNNKSYYALTQLGEKLIELGDNLDENIFNEQQYELISDFVQENPFYSQITFSILSVVDTIFVLSKAEYPVKYEIFQDFFTRSLGKEKTWNAQQTKKLGTRHFITYAKELGFIHEIGCFLYLTPKGINALLTFQLNRSIKLINARK